VLIAAGRRLPYRFDAGDDHGAESLSWAEPLTDEVASRDAEHWYQGDDSAGHRGGDLAQPDEVEPVRKNQPGDLLGVESSPVPSVRL
jgi:hypothetical protein